MSRVYSIKCTKCSAPLNLLGGGRIQTVTCAYCKSVIDLNNDYKVLSNFKSYQEKNQLPFEIGMKGLLNSIAYTIIGRITYQEAEPPFSEWSDFLLFSPLYGYGWLTYENGHLSYSRRNRTFPNIEWNSIDTQSKIMVDGVAFKPFCHYTAKVVYVEGELTWIAKKGDNTTFIDLIAPPLGISAEKTKDEIEYYKSEYLEPSVVYNAFNIPKEKQVEPKEFNILKPFKRPLLEALSTVSLWVMVITAFLFLSFMIDGSGDTVSVFRLEGSKQIDSNFTITSNKYLTYIKLKSNSSKGLKNFNIKIYKNQKMLFSLSGESAYRFNLSTQKIEKKLLTWSSSAKTIAIYLKLKASGEYRFIANPINPKINSTLEVTIKEKKVYFNYIELFAILSFIGFILHKVFYSKYKRELQEEQTISHEEDALFSSFYRYLSNNIFLFLLSIYIVFLIIQEI